MQESLPLAWKKHGSSDATRNDEGGQRVGRRGQRTKEGLGARKAGSTAGGRKYRVRRRVQVCVRVCVRVLSGCESSEMWEWGGLGGGNLADDFTNGGAIAAPSQLSNQP